MPVVPYHLTLTVGFKKFSIHVGKIRINEDDINLAGLNWGPPYPKLRFMVGDNNKFQRY